MEKGDKSLIKKVIWEILDDVGLGGETIKTPSSAEAMPVGKPSSSGNRNALYKAPSEISARDEFTRIRLELAAQWSRLGAILNSGGPTEFPLLYENEKSKVVIMDEKTFGNPENWFFIGDIHGDFFALHTLLTSIKQECPDFRLVFMGDLVDRGEQPIECFFLILKWAQAHPERIIWLAGNHDIAFSYNKVNHRFDSSVDPSEFLDFLNTEDEMQSFRKLLGEFLVKLSGILPRAVLFPDGLLATHGGFPLCDLQEQGKQMASREAFLEWLASPPCLQDFTWTRITVWPKKALDRPSKGCEYGFKDFEAFCDLKPEWFPVKRMLTGHEHPETGWEDFPTYKRYPAATICGFGFDYLIHGPGKFRKYKPRLILGRYRLNLLPERVEIDYSLSELQKFYPPQTPPPPISAKPA
jgi:hypothetical protein